MGAARTGVISRKFCTKLLELAAIDDLSEFRNEIERGCDLNEVGFWYGRSFSSNKMGFEERTPLMIASLCGSTSVLKYVLESGKVDVNRARGSDGATALHCAAAGGSWSSLEVVKILIDAFADVNAVDANGKRAVDLVAPCVKSSNSSKRKALEKLLNGAVEGSEPEEEEEEEEERKTPKASEKKEYPVDTSLPDINSGIYGTDEFRMYSFKVMPCSRAYTHDWTECPFVHPGENARRRDLRKYQYTCVPCSEFKKGSCSKGDSCEYAHGVFESWLHPAQYRTRICKEETGCSRKVCFFAHKPVELRPVYASTGSALPSPKSLDLGSLSPMSVGSPSSINCSSPMSGGTPWQSKSSVSPPALQLPGSRLKTALSARDMDLDMEIQNQQRHQLLVEQMAGLSSPYSRMGGGELKRTNLEDLFGSYELSLASQFQGLSPKYSNTSSSPKFQPTAGGIQSRQNFNQLRSSYPSNISSSAAVAAAVLNSRTSAFTKRSQSFIDRDRSALASSIGFVPSKHSEWSSLDGKLDWGFNGGDANMLRKSPSMGIRSRVPTPQLDEPDFSWVNSLVKDVPSGEPRRRETAAPHWLEQMYLEQEQAA